MELKAVEPDRIAGLRAERRRGSTLTLVPGFYSRLSEGARSSPDPGFRRGREERFGIWAMSWRSIDLTLDTRT